MGSKNKKELRLLYTTVVYPDEYNIEEQMVETIKLSNEEKSCYLSMDVGKMIGLWKAYKELKEQYNNEFGGQK